MERAGIEMRNAGLPGECYRLAQSVGQGRMHIRVASEDRAAVRGNDPWNLALVLSAEAEEAVNLAEPTSSLSTPKLAVGVTYCEKAVAYDTARVELEV